MAAPRKVRPDGPYTIPRGAATADAKRRRGIHRSARHKTVRACDVEKVMRRQIRFAGILAGLWSSVLVCSVDVLGQQAVSSMPRVATPGSMGQQVLSQAVPNDPGGLRVGFQSDERHLDACLQRPGLTLAAASDRDYVRPSWRRFRTTTRRSPRIIGSTVQCWIISCPAISSSTPHSIGTGQSTSVSLAPRIPIPG